MINKNVNVQLDCIGHAINDLEAAWDTILTPTDLWKVVEGAFSKAGLKNIAFYSRSASVFQNSESSQLHFIQFADSNFMSDIELTKPDEDTLLHNLEHQFLSPFTQVAQIKSSPFSNLSEIQIKLEEIEDDTSTYIIRHYGANCHTGYTVFNSKGGNLFPLSRRVNFLRALSGSIHDKLAQISVSKAQGIPTISPREKQVLQLLIKGKTNGEIATGLSISPYTIGSYINSLGLKLSSKNRTTTAIKAVALGLVKI